MTYAALALLGGVPVILGIAGAAAGTRVAHALAAAAMTSVLAGVLAAEPVKTLTIGGAALGLTQIARLELGFLCLLGLALTSYHYLAGRTSPLPALLPPLIAAVAVSRIFGPQLLVAASFLLFASLLASLLMISEQQEWQASVAGATYLVLAALGGMALLFGFVLANLQRLSPGGLVTIPFVVAVLSVGLALQWGVAPFHFWLPTAFQRAGPTSIALAVSVMGPATLGLLLQALSALPQLVADERVNASLTLGGLITAFFGALAALAPGKLRRRIGYVLVSDIGYVLVGMATYTRIGVAGAALHMAGRALVALLMVTAAAELERDDRAAPEQPPAPYMWGTLLVGSLVLSGVAPLSGFAANWAIYQAAALSDWRLALALAVASLLCLAALLRALGELRREYPRPWRRPRPVEAWVIGTAAVAALWGLIPGPLLGAVHAAVSQLPFLKPF